MDGGPYSEKEPPHLRRFRHRLQGHPVAKLSPQELANTLKDGLLSFPVTSFDAELQFDEENYRKHLAWQASYPVAGLFAAGGTGEGFSLTPAESARVVR